MQTVATSCPWTPTTVAFSDRSRMASFFGELNAGACAPPAPARGILCSPEDRHGFSFHFSLKERWLGWEHGGEMGIEGRHAIIRPKGSRISFRLQLFSVCFVLHGKLSNRAHLIFVTFTTRIWSQHTSLKKHFKFNFFVFLCVCVLLAYMCTACGGQKKVSDP